MTYAVLDVESTIFQKGHPFSERNRLCLVGVRRNSINHLFDVEYSGTPYATKLNEIQDFLDNVDCVVGFNLKFDLNWLARYGVTLPDHIRVFDCQLAEFILNHQSTPFPSLDGCLAKYGLGSKSTVVPNSYWSQGIDTPEIPLDILSTYLRDDLELTDALYTSLSLRKDVQTTLRPLLQLHMQDLRVLQEMECNGIYMDWAAMDAARQCTEEELNEINTNIVCYVPPEGRSLFSTSSNDDLSALLYGGVREYKRGTPYLHKYKSGGKAGTSDTRMRWDLVRVEFPRLVAPLDGTALAKEGKWSVGTDVLRQLPKPKALLSLLLKQSEKSKLLDTYLVGFPTVAKKKDWQDGKMHSTLNQCTVITGRLSSSSPNIQNMPEEMNEYIVTRF